MSSPSTTHHDRKRRALTGTVIVAMIAFQIGRETTAYSVFPVCVVALLLVLIAIISFKAGRAVRIFLLASVALTILQVTLNPGWRDAIWSALLSSGFFVAFFSSLAALRNAASSSPAMAEAGTFLARQPPGRRYLALTAGAQVFAMLLNYGAIQLLGSLALASANSEPDERIRTIRTRRMLLAIHRGFVSSLPWSPLSFSIAISTAVIPGTSWSSLAVPGLVTSLIILGTGWAMDTIFKPRPTGIAPRPFSSAGRWTSLAPLALLLILTLSLLGFMESLLHIRVVGLVLIIIPCLSLAWIILQLGGTEGLGERLASYLVDDLPSYGKEIMIIATAGYIGATGSSLITPHIGASGLDLSAMPTWLLLVLLVWIMPALGQIGANPILSMSLIAPLLPPAAELGISPTALAVALICGWTMTGITSPFTATNLLIGRFGGIRPVDVGWVWNRGYFLVTTLLLCCWALTFAFLIA